MNIEDLPNEFIEQCKQVTAKRPRTLIDHILKHGYVTTEELKNEYGYNHPPRAARDVRELGIPLETFRVEGTDGRKIAAYRFGDPSEARFSKLSGRTALSNRLKARLIELYGSKCFIYCEEFEERLLQIDHRIPFEVGGDPPDEDPQHFILLCGSANRAKSWSCEHCANWNEIKDPEICSTCYWAFPESYTHIAMRNMRRIDITWSENEIEIYDKLIEKAHEQQTNLQEYVKEILRRNLDQN